MPRHLPCPESAEKRPTFPQDILRVVGDELQYLIVSPFYFQVCHVFPTHRLDHRFSAGTVGPVVFGLSLRDSCLVIFFFNVLCCTPPAYLYVHHNINAILPWSNLSKSATWGPKLGLRQMCQARYSFGYAYPLIICIGIASNCEQVLRCHHSEFVQLGYDGGLHDTELYLGWTDTCSSVGWKSQLDVSYSSYMALVNHTSAST